MVIDEVVRVYQALDRGGVRIWIDGGWSVDALLGRITRPHDDLDIAVARNQNARFLSLTEGLGYAVRAGWDPAQDNYLVESGRGVIDVHVFEFGADGRLIWGIDYPPASLTGTGTLAGQPVRCISAEYALRFKAAHEPRPKDRDDVRALAAAFGLETPEPYRD